MSRVEIAKQATQICKENYNTNCGRCPIRSECIAHIGQGQEAFNKWVERVNAAVERVWGFERG